MSELAKRSDVARKAPAKKAAKTAPVKKAPAKNAAVKAPAKKAPAKKAPAKKAPAKKAPAKKAPAKKAAAKAAAKKAAKKAPAKKAASKKSGPKHSRTDTPPPPKSSADGPTMAVRALPAPSEDPMVILGLTEPFSPAQLRRAWRNYATRHHPDQGGDALTFDRGRHAFEALRTAGW